MMYWAIACHVATWQSSSRYHYVGMALNARRLAPRTQGMTLMQTPDIPTKSTRLWSCYPGFYDGTTDATQEIIATDFLDEALSQPFFQFIPFRTCLPSLRHLTGNNGALSSQGDIIKLCLGCDDHSAFPSEVEICRCHAYEDFAQECAGGVPNVHSIADSRVHITVGVAVDTVWDARRHIAEQLAIAPCTVLFDGEAIAGDLDSASVILPGA